MNNLMYFKCVKYKYYSIGLCFFPVGYVLEGYLKSSGILTSSETKKISIYFQNLRSGNMFN